MHRNEYLEDVNVGLQKDDPRDATENVVDVCVSRVEFIKHRANQKAVKCMQKELHVVHGGIAVGNEHEALEQRFELLPVRGLCRRRWGLGGEWLEVC